MTQACARNLSIGLLILATALPGCGVRQRLGFGPAQPATPLPFEAELTQSESDPRAFAVEVEANGNGLDATRESVRFPATAFCLRTFGNTEVTWMLDPSGEWAGVPREGGVRVYSGRCTGR